MPKRESGEDTLQMIPLFGKHALDGIPLLFSPYMFIYPRVVDGAIICRDAGHFLWWLERQWEEEQND